MCGVFSPLHRQFEFLLASPNRPERRSSSALESAEQIRMDESSSSEPLVLVVGSVKARTELARAVLQYDELLASDAGEPTIPSASPVNLGTALEAFR